MSFWRKAVARRGYIYTWLAMDIISNVHYIDMEVKKVVLWCLVHAGQVRNLCACGIWYLGSRTAYIVCTGPLGRSVCR